MMIRPVSLAVAGFSLLASLLLPTAWAAEGDLVLSASIEAGSGAKPARLVIAAQIEPGWNTYSVTQPAGGPVRTRIKLDSHPDVQFSAEGFAARPGAKPVREAAFAGVVSEKHEGKWIWETPVEIAAGTDLSRLEVTGAVTAQRCHEKQGCLFPETFRFVARVRGGGAPAVAGETAPKGRLRLAGGENEPAAKKPTAIKPAVPAGAGATGQHRESAGRATIHGRIERREVLPGERVAIVLTVEPDALWHVYQWEPNPKRGVGSKPTLIAIREPQWIAITPQADRPVVAAKDSNAPPHHEGTVTWRVELEVPEDAAPGEYPLSGLIGYQTCQRECIRPLGAEFSTTIVVRERAPAEAGAALAFKSAGYPVVEKLAQATADQWAAPGPKTSPAPAHVISNPSPPRPATTPGEVPLLDFSQLKPRGEERDLSLGTALLLAFLGGLCLNVMPCVLPVIGLKVLSFVQQAGEDRGRIFWLNFCYSLGIMLVFLALGVMAVVAGLGWGQHFQDARFNIAMACIVFAFALSLLGVWEMPTPGIAGGKSANKLARKEGAAGAIFKGALTTLLATPCTGPFMGAALTWAVAQPKVIALATFGSLGLGMASPYLLLGLFPKAIKLLPRPGAWMDTFKHLSGFALIATVVWFLTFIPSSMVVPTVACLAGLGLACWWFGRVPLGAESGERLRGWGAAVVIALAGGWFSFGWLMGVTATRHQAAIDREVSRKTGVPPPSLGGVTDLAWHSYSRAALQDATAGQATILVDFTADWCATCKLNEAIVLNTAATKKVIEALGVVTLKADMTEENAEALELLAALRLDAKQVPYYVVFPAGRPNEPIVFSGLISFSKVEEVLAQAGPSATVVAQRRDGADATTKN